MVRVRLLRSTSSADTRLAPEDGDLLVAAVADWEAKRCSLDTMIFRWQGLEDKLAHKARELGVGFADACGGDLPEARAMRVLDIKISATQRKLNDRVSEIRNIAGTTVAGAIAKVRLGLAAQGKFDWQDNARELIEEGIEELHLLAKGVPTGQGPAS